KAKYCRQAENQDKTAWFARLVFSTMALPPLQPEFMTTKKASYSLIKDDIQPTLVAMTLPMLVGMITLMTFNLVDTFFISMLGTVQLAAISFTFPVSFTLISLSIGLSIGTSAVIAKALGGGNLTEARTDGQVALWLSAVLVAVLAVLGYAFTSPLFTALGADASTLSYIRQYMDIWFCGAVLLVLPMVGNAVLRASGDTKTPSIIMACSGLVNAVLDPILIFGFGPLPAMGMHGAAIATVISWVFGSALILYLLVKRGLIATGWIKPVLLLSICRKILRIGLPAAGANMLTPLAMGVLTALMATYGAEAVAAFGVGARIESIASLVVLALSMTLPPFVSQNYGACAYHRIHDAYRSCIKFILAWQFVVYIGLAACAWVVADLFTEDPLVAQYIRYFIWILPLG